jgi:hypothetical protein
MTRIKIPNVYEHITILTSILGLKDRCGECTLNVSGVDFVITNFYEENTFEAYYRENGKIFKGKFRNGNVIQSEPSADRVDLNSHNLPSLNNCEDVSTWMKPLKSEWLTSLRKNELVYIIPSENGVSLRDRDYIPFKGLVFNDIKSAAEALVQFPDYVWIECYSKDYYEEVILPK